MDCEDQQILTTLEAEDNTGTAEHLDELKSETFANTSDDEFISDPKQSMPFKVIPEKRKPEISTNCLKKHKKDILNVTDTSEKSHGNIIPKLHECEFCGYASYFKHNVKVHTRKHTGERPYICSFCPKAFADSSVLTRHRRTHTNEHPYVCGICGKSFKTNVLRKHKRQMHNMIKAPEAPHRIVKPKPFECETCGRSFGQKTHLKCHMMIHTGERPYKCSYCPATFSNGSSLKRHHRTHLNERPFVCDICNRSFTTNCLRAHKREAHNIFDFGEKCEKSRENIKPKLYYHCEKCERIFAKKETLMLHMRKTHDNGIQADEKLNERTQNPKLDECDTNTNEREKSQESINPKLCYHCEKCEQTFTEKGNVRRHMRNIHGIEADEKLKTRKKEEKEIKNPKLYECKICGKSFRKSYLQHHMTIHSEKDRYKCSVCSATFESSLTLRLHYRLHINEPQHVCDICGKSFNSIYVLSSHKKTMHMMKIPKTYKCETCKSTFAQKPLLERHMVIHTGEHLYKCSYCPAVFVYPKTVRIHERTHTKERSYVCNICNKSFTANGLITHKREAHNLYDCGEKSQESIKSKFYDCGIQTGEELNENVENSKLYECEICGRTFLKSLYLKYHNRLHTNKRIYKCCYCPAAFSDASTRTKHYRYLHPHICHVCGKSFTYKSIFKLHKMIHTRGKLYVCNVCGKGFKKEAELYNHTLTLEINSKPLISYHWRKENFMY